MIRQYRAWYPTHNEPTEGFPILAAAAHTAARDFVCGQLGIAAKFSPDALPALQAIALHPQRVLVREEDSFRSEPHQFLVTAAIEATVWGYPADIDAPDAP